MQRMKGRVLLLSKCPGCDDPNIAQGFDKMQFFKATGSSERDKGKGKMSDVAETHLLFQQAFPLRRYGSVKAMINAAVTFISPRVQKEFTHRRARSIWEQSARRIDGEEKDAIRQAVIEEDRREQREIRARLAALDARLASVDEAFHGPTLEALRSQASGLGGVHNDRKDR